MTQPDPSEISSACFLGIPLSLVDTRQLIETAVQWGKQDRLRRVYNVNVHGLILAYRNRDFMHFLQDADLVFCDGYGIKFGARMLGINVPQRMTPPDWIDDFASAVARAGQSVFALGDEEGVASLFQQTLAANHKGYLDAGSSDGFFDKTGPENDALIDRINSSGAVHLLVGFGMPLQERWIEANRDRLAVKVVYPVGALFRWYVGYEWRAPKWMSDHGLEWFARLMRHPIRHFRRYVLGNTLFLARVFKARAGIGSTEPCAGDASRSAEDVAPPADLSASNVSGTGTRAGRSTNTDELSKE